MQKSILNKLLMARRLLELSREHLGSANGLSLSIGVNLLQDSVEVFLLAVAEQVGAAIQAKTNFDQYLNLIDEKITPKSLPFRARLFALNKLRVNSKHHGLAPAESEVSGLLVTVRELYDEVTTSIFGVSFASISLIDLLSDGEAKDMLRGAEQALGRREFDLCLFNCRKAIFVSIEHEYDIAPFADDSLSGARLAFLTNKAPYYTRNKEYIANHVGDPTDYIVLDHSVLDMDLLRMGIDPVSFWNVWRLTPEVYRAEAESPWVHKHDFVKLEEEGLSERAEYVLDTTIAMLASADQKKAATRWTKRQRYSVSFKREGVPIYEKASLNSKIKDHVPEGLTSVDVDCVVDALDGPGRFLHVVHYENPLFLTGYVPEDEVQGNRRLTPVLPLSPLVPEAAGHERSRSAGDVALAEAAQARALDVGPVVGMVGAPDLEAALLATAA